jgi:hypothetical protein
MGARAFSQLGFGLGIRGARSIWISSGAEDITFLLYERAGRKGVSGFKFQVSAKADRKGSRLMKAIGFGLAWPKPATSNSKRLSLQRV